MDKVYTTFAKFTAGLKTLGYSDPIHHRNNDGGVEKLPILVLGDREQLPKIKELDGNRRVVDVSELDTRSDLMAKSAGRSMYMKTVHGTKPIGVIYFIPLVTENGVKIPVNLNGENAKHCIPGISWYLTSTVFIDTSWDLIDDPRER